MTKLQKFNTFSQIFNYISSRKSTILRKVLKKIKFSKVLYEKHFKVFLTQLYGFCKIWLGMICLKLYI